MEKLTRQQIFDRAYLGLASQNWKPCMLGDKCVYKMDDGKHCAIGWVVPELTGSDGIYQLHNENAKLFYSVIHDDDLDFCQYLQRCHDNPAFNNSSIKTAMERFADKYGLVIPGASESVGQPIHSVANNTH